MKHFQDEGFQGFSTAEVETARQLYRQLQQEGDDIRYRDSTICKVYENIFRVENRNSLMCFRVGGTGWHPGVPGTILGRHFNESFGLSNGCERFEM